MLFSVGTRWQDALVPMTIILWLFFAVGQSVAANPGSRPSNKIWDLDIPEKTTQQALFQLAENIEIHVIFAEGVVAKDLRSPAIHGRYTIINALDRLLEGTGLSYTFLADKLVIVESSIGAGIPTDSSKKDVLHVVDDTALTIEEILITAQRRSENLQTVPIAVSVLPSPVLAKADIVTLDQAVTLLPSLTYSSGVEPRNTSIRIRGIGTQSFSLAVEPSVSVIIDGIVTGRPGAAAEDIADIERIEVLRGPQSILFGKNASAGIVNIVTKSPNADDFEGYFKVGFAEQGEADVRLAVTGPINDRFSFRFNTFYRNWGGVASNINLNEQAGGINSSYGLRGKLGYTDEAVLDAILTIDVSSKNSECCVRAGRINFVDNSFLERSGTPVGLENINVSEDADVFSKTDNIGISLEWNRYLSGDYVVRYLGGYRRWKNSVNLDNDSTRFNFVLHQGGTTTSQVTSQEIRLESPLNGLWDYVAGFYAFYHKADRDFKDEGCLLSELDETTFNVDFGLISGCSLEEGTFGSGNFFATVENTNLALFGQLNIHPTDKLTMITGFRWLYENLDFQFLRNNPDTGNLGGLLPGKFAAADGTSDKKLIWKIGAKYQLVTDMMSYATISTGYKGQAYSISQPLTREVLANEPLNPEESINLELGIKSSFFKDRLIVNAALFSTEIEGFQIQGRDTVTDDVFLRNAADIETLGAEFEFTALPTPSLSLTGGITFLDASFKNFPNGLCYPGQAVVKGCVNSAQDLSGADFINAPDIKFTVSGKYDFDFFGWDAFIQTAYTWQDDVLFSLNQDPNRVQESYGLLHAKTGLISPGGVEITLQGKNLTDQFYVTDIFRNVGTVMSQNGYYHTFARDVRRYFGGSITFNF